MKGIINLAVKALRLAISGAVFAQSGFLLEAVAESSVVREVVVAESKSLNAGFATGALSNLIASRGDGRGFFAITGFGNSVVMFSPWGAVEATYKFDQFEYTSSIFSLGSGKAIVFGRSKNPASQNEYSIISVGDSGGKPTILASNIRYSPGFRWGTGKPSSVLMVTERLALFSSTNSTWVQFLELQEPTFWNPYWWLDQLRSVDIGVLGAQMAQDPSSGEVYAFGMAPGSSGLPEAVVFRPESSLFLSPSTKDPIAHSVTRIPLSLYPFGGAKANFLKAFVTDAFRYDRIGAVSQTDMRVLGDSYSVAGGPSTMTADGRYLLIGQPNSTNSCGGALGGINYVPLELGNIADNNKRCLLPASGSEGLFVDDLYIDPTSKLTFGYVHDLSPDKNQAINTRLSILKMATDTTALQRATQLVNDARANCATAQILDGYTIPACKVFDSVTSASVAKQ